MTPAWTAGMFSATFCESQSGEDIIALATLHGPPGVNRLSVGNQQVSPSPCLEMQSIVDGAQLNFSPRCSQSPSIVASFAATQDGVSNLSVTGIWG